MGKGGTRENSNEKDRTESRNVESRNAQPKKLCVSGLKENKLGKPGWSKGRKGLDQTEAEVEGEIEPYGKAMCPQAFKEAC